MQVECEMSVEKKVRIFVAWVFSGSSGFLGGSLSIVLVIIKNIYLRIYGIKETK